LFKPIGNQTPTIFALTSFVTVAIRTLSYDVTKAIAAQKTPLLRII
jgi:hypothetical protein